MIVKFDLDAWSDAELDLISAKAVIGQLEVNLFHDGSKSDAEIAAIYNSGNPWPVVGMDVGTAPLLLLGD